MSPCYPTRLVTIAQVRQAPSLLKQGGETRFYPEIGGNMLNADAAIDLFVPVINSALLITQGHTTKTRRLNTVLHRFCKKNVFFSDAVKVFYARFPQRVAGGAPQSGANHSTSRLDVRSVSGQSRGSVTMRCWPARS